jgi:hypothetical protein
MPLVLFETPFITIACEEMNDAASSPSAVPAAQVVVALPFFWLLPL